MKHTWFLTIEIEVEDKQVEGKTIGEIEKLISEGVETKLGMSKSGELLSFRRDDCPRVKIDFDGDCE